jgi:hypothetical protein
MTTKIKVWIDDLRQPPDDSWVWLKTLDEAFYVVANNDLEIISFDHDLGEDKAGNPITVRPLVSLIEDLAFWGTSKPFRWQVHSANPVGKKWICLAMENADRYWEFGHGIGATLVANT